MVRYVQKPHPEPTHAHQRWLGQRNGFEETTLKSPSQSPSHVIRTPVPDMVGKNMYLSTLSIF